MGVALVFEYNASVKELAAKLETAGSEIIGSYSVDCLPFRAKESTINIPTNYVLHHTHFPQCSFSIAPQGYYITSPRATCDKGFDLILTKLTCGLIPDNGGNFQVSGQEFRLKDFVVRIGAASQGTTVKGTIVEIEYEPLQIASMSNMLTEFIKLFFADYATIKISEVLDSKSTCQYTALETLYQYLRIFMLMRTRNIDDAN